MPLFSELMAQGAGDAIKGIYGTANWDWKLDDDGSKAFTKSFGAKYGQPPSQAAHTCYVQALLYADAVRDAPAPSIRRKSIKALEGFEFDGMGNGPTLYRAADHQCFKDVLVVQGKEEPTNKFDLLEVVKEVPAEYPIVELGARSCGRPAELVKALVTERFRYLAAPQQCLERVVVLGVETADALQPDAGGAQPVRQQPAADRAPGAGLLDEAGVGEDAQVLGDRGQRHRVRLGELADRAVAREQRGQDRPPRRVRERGEDQVEIAGLTLHPR